VARDGVNGQKPSEKVISYGGRFFHDIPYFPHREKLERYYAQEVVRKLDGVIARAGSLSKSKVFRERSAY
jgi:hypothetical protein